MGAPSTLGQGQWRRRQSWAWGATSQETAQLSWLGASRNWGRMGRRPASFRGSGALGTLLDVSSVAVIRSSSHETLWALFLRTFKWPKRRSGWPTRGLACLVSWGLIEVLLCVRHQLGRDQGRFTVSECCHPLSPIPGSPRSHRCGSRVEALQTAGGAGHVHRGATADAFPRAMSTHRQSWPPAPSTCVASPTQCLILGDICVCSVYLAIFHMCS